MKSVKTWSAAVGLLFLGGTILSPAGRAQNAAEKPAQGALRILSRRALTIGATGTGRDPTASSYAGWRIRRGVTSRTDGTR